VTYLLLYTPLKPVTSLCSIVGAVPGALPPVVGWAAARGTLGTEAWVLFAIMFLWQIPHSLAIGRVYRDDYARAGIRVLPVVDPDGTSTGTHVVSNCLALVPVALLPTLIGLAGPLYFLVALALGLVYLPVLLGVMALDKLTS
jgi:protoheme IX farnesyltransferase